jgi:hypothetical protein
LDNDANREYTGSVRPTRPTIGETGTKLPHREIFHKRFFANLFGELQQSQKQKFAPCKA